MAAPPIIGAAVIIAAPAAEEAELAAELAAEPAEEVALPAAEVALPAALEALPAASDAADEAEAAALEPDAAREEIAPDALAAAEEAAPVSDEAIPAPPAMEKMVVWVTRVETALPPSEMTELMSLVVIGTLLAPAGRSEVPVAVAAGAPPAVTPTAAQIWRPYSATAVSSSGPQASMVQSRRP